MTVVYPKKLSLNNEKRWKHLSVTIIQTPSLELKEPINLRSTGVANNVSDTKYKYFS